PAPAKLAAWAVGRGALRGRHRLALGRRQGVDVDTAERRLRRNIDVHGDPPGERSELRPARHDRATKRSWAANPGPNAGLRRRPPSTISRGCASLPSSRGLGRGPLKAETRVRIP